MSTAPNVTIIPAKIQTAENRDKYHQLKVAAWFDSAKKSL